jgi:hypothetical protein
MTITLGTVSEMTKGFRQGPLPDDPMKSPPFPLYQQLL